MTFDLTQGGLALWLVLGVALLILAVAVTVRVVPAYERAVVTRLGRPHRVAASGLVGVVPLLDRVRRVSVLPVRVDPLVVTAVTRDGAEVRVVASTLLRVVDPVVAVGVPEPFQATSGAVERALRRTVTAVRLDDLATARTGLAARVQQQLSGSVSAWGVRVLEVDIDDVELRLLGDRGRLVR